MPYRLLASLCVALGLICPPAHAQAPSVELVQLDSGQHRLLVNGEPFFIKGGGGDGDKALLAASGGNAFRTWGVGDDTPARLERAQANGLMVAIGFWLGHERHGFDYGDAEALAEQTAMVREGVLKYRDHPNVLMWVLGNEMEGFAEGDDPRIWRHVQELAAMVKSLDPHRPTATVVAEIGGKRIESIHRHCPDIDIVGINSYAGAMSIPQRYREAGGTRPYMLTEFGPPGTWETGRTSFDAAPELTSTQKGEVYDRVWQQTIEGDDLCLGGFAFTWGFKQEATATWFGMFLPDGSKLAPVDAMHEQWTGRPPANRCPVVQPLTLAEGDQTRPGQRITVRLDASDPDGDDLAVEWRVHEEASRYNTGGDPEDPTPHYPDAVVEADLSHAVIEVPDHAGVYRIYAFVRDGQGAAAVANVPIVALDDNAENAAAGDTGPQRASTPRAADDGKPADLPFWLYADGMRALPYIPSGYMGGAAGVTMTPDAEDHPRSGKTALKVVYDGTAGWAGVVWQDPADDWGDVQGGYDLTDAKALSFWARGQEGGEKVKFGLGLYGRDKPYFDTAKGEQEVTLTQAWKRYTIPLERRDLSRIKSGFYWVAGQPVTFYLDDVAYVGEAGAEQTPRDQTLKTRPAMSPGKPLKDAVVYREGGDGAWVPSGYMGDAEAVTMSPRHAGDPRHGEHSLHVRYDATEGWAGVVWQDPPDDWGDLAGGYDLRGKSSLTFHARGDAGGETVKFGVGLLGDDATYPDSGSQEIEVTLTPEWKAYTIDLSDTNLQRIKTGFYWVAAANGKPIAFSLDEIVYE